MNMIKVKLRLCGYVIKDMKLWSNNEDKANYYVYAKPRREK